MNLEIRGNSEELRYCNVCGGVKFEMVFLRNVYFAGFSQVSKQNSSA